MYKETKEILQKQLEFLSKVSETEKGHELAAISESMLNIAKFLEVMNGNFSSSKWDIKI